MLNLLTEGSPLSILVILSFESRYINFSNRLVTSRWSRGQWFIIALRVGASQGKVFIGFLQAEI